MAFVTGGENYTATDPADAMWAVIDYLITSVGWTKRASSDGLTGAEVTSGASGANGLDNSFAWVELESPNGFHAVQWQRSNVNSTQWRVVVLYGASSGGTTTQTPAASGVWWNQVGSGTPAAPGFLQCFADTGAQVIHCVGDTASYASTNVHRFWYAAHKPSDPRITTPFALDAVIGHPDDTHMIAAWSKYATAATYYSFGPYYTNLGSNTELSSHTGTTNAGRIMSALGPSLTPTAGQMATVGNGANIWAHVYANTAEDHPWAWDNSHATAPCYIGTSKTSPPALGTGLKGAMSMWEFGLSSQYSLGDLLANDTKVALHDTTVGSGSGCPVVFMPWIAGSSWSLT